MDHTGTGGDRNIYIADAGNNRITRWIYNVFGINGFFRPNPNGSIGGLNNPNDVFFVDSPINKIYVADTGNNRIAVFNASTGHQFL
jgi:DNA-binding beta-propeller fold protein YncE